jgi:predicted DNA-binding protein YlxM (UPF0122 family)
MDYRKNYKIERSSSGLFEHLCKQMELVAAKEISLDEAKEQGNLVKQANNVLRYELDVKKYEQKLAIENK